MISISAPVYLLDTGALGPVSSNAMQAKFSRTMVRRLVASTSNCSMAFELSVHSDRRCFCVSVWNIFFSMLRTLGCIEQSFLERSPTQQRTPDN